MTEEEWRQVIRYVDEAIRETAPSGIPRAELQMFLENVRIYLIGKMMRDYCKEEELNKSSEASQGGGSMTIKVFAERIARMCDLGKDATYIELIENNLISFQVEILAEERELRLKPSKSSMVSLEEGKI